MILADNGSPWYISGAPEPALEQRRAARARPADRPRLPGRRHELASAPRAVGTRPGERRDCTGGRIRAASELSRVVGDHRLTDSRPRTARVRSPSTGWCCRRTPVRCSSTSAAAATRRLSTLADAGSAQASARIPGRAGCVPDHAHGPGGDRQLDGCAAAARPAHLRARRRRRVAVAGRPRGDVRRAERDDLGERRLRSLDGRREPGAEPLAVRLGGFGPRGRERLHYPDLLLVTADGRRVALELELTAEEPRRRRETILAGYGADPRVDASSTSSSAPAIARSIQRGGAPVGIAPLVHVRRVRSTVSRTPPRPPPARERSATTGRGARSEAAREAAEAHAPSFGRYLSSRRSWLSLVLPAGGGVAAHRRALARLRASRGARSHRAAGAPRPRAGEGDDRARRRRARQAGHARRRPAVGARADPRRERRRQVDDAADDPDRPDPPRPAGGRDRHEGLAGVRAPARRGGGRGAGGRSGSGRSTAARTGTRSRTATPTELKDKLIATERFTEPHYQRAAERYVQTVLQVLARAHPGPARRRSTRSSR